MILVFDSWAWLSVAEGDKACEAVLNHLNGRQNEVFTTALNLYEVQYILRERVGQNAALEFIESIKSKAKIIDIDAETASLAADIHLAEKLSSVDAFVYAAAVKLGGKVLTGDPHFKGKEFAIFLG